MRTKFGYSHIDINLVVNLISGIWAEPDVSMANGHLQECRESKEVAEQKENKYTLDARKIVEAKYKKEIHIRTTNKNKT